MVAVMSCGAVAVALCGSAHAAVPSPTAVTRTVASSLSDASVPRIADPTTDPVSSLTDTAGGVADTVTRTTEPITGATRPDPERIVKKVVTTVKGVVEKVLPSPEAISDRAVVRQHTPTLGTSVGTTREHKRASAIHRHAARRGPFRVSHPLSFTDRRDLTSRSDQTAVARSSGGLVHELGRAARDVAFPALLALLVVAFLLAQDRIDKRDPKLMIGSPEPDGELVVFE